jgi:formate/nitrite transporter
MAIGLVYRKYSLLRVIRNWVTVYAGNLIGSIIIAYLVWGSGLLGDASVPSAVGSTAATIAESKLALPFAAAFSRGILCNMLVCLAVIMCMAARTMEGKILGIYFPIMAFVASGYEHSIANMYFLSACLLVKGEFPAQFLFMFKNLIPVTLGNIIGGLAVVLLHPKVQARIAKNLTFKQG